MLIGAAPTIQAIQRRSKVKPRWACRDSLAPRRALQSTIANALEKEPGMTLLCGRYEGFDERVRPMSTIDLSFGDFVLSGGTLLPGA